MSAVATTAFQELTFFRKDSGGGTAREVLREGIFPHRTCLLVVYFLQEWQSFHVDLFLAATRVASLSF